MSEQYTYAVARIRALEVSLFSDSTIDQLIACQNYDQALQFLEEKGWGDARKQRGCGKDPDERRRKDMGSSKRTVDRNGTFRCAFLSEAFS